MPTNMNPQLVHNPLAVRVGRLSGFHSIFRAVHSAVAKPDMHMSHTDTATPALQDEDYELPAPTRGGRGRRGRGTAPRTVSRTVSSALRTISRRSSSFKEVLAASGGSGEAWAAVPVSLRS